MVPKKMVESVNYEVMGVLDILETGSSLADEIGPASIFQSSCKFFVIIVEQLSACLAKQDPRR